MRSRAAASVLKTAGFEDTHSMEGGIFAWKGLTAKGAPEAGMTFFPPTATHEELIALAWLLEEGSRAFYAEIAATMADEEAKGLFKDLVSAEEHHMAALRGLFSDLTGGEPGPDFPSGVIALEEQRMEGAVKVAEALEWAKGQEPRRVLELSISLETNSYDLYIKLGRRAEGEKEKRVFASLAHEEQDHLSRMAKVLEKLF